MWNPGGSRFQVGEDSHLGVLTRDEDRRGQGGGESSSIGTNSSFKAYQSWCIFWLFVI